MPQYAIIDDTDPGLTYTGIWRVLTDPVNPRAPDYNGTVHATNDPTATVSYKFYGSMLSVYGTLDTPNGYPNASFTVSPNAVPLTHLNQTGHIQTLIERTWAITHLELFTSDRLTTGNYTMDLKTDGVRQAGPTFYLDFLTVLIPDSISIPLDKVIVDDDDPQWKFTGDWTRINRPGNYKDTVHRSNNNNVGMSATLQFEGTEVTVYGTLVGTYTDFKPIGYFQIDGGDNHTVMASDIPITTEAPANDGAMRGQKIFTTSGLSPGKHTLTVVAPPNPDQPSTAPTPANPPWFLDCAVYGPALPNFSPGVGDSNPQNPSGSSSPGPPTGAIVGGVIGAIVVLGALIAGFLLWRRRRRVQVSTEKAEVHEEFILDTPAVTPYKDTESTSGIAPPGRSLSMHKPMGNSYLALAPGGGSDPGSSFLAGTTVTGPLSPGGSSGRGLLSRTVGSGTESYTEGTTISDESPVPTNSGPSNRRRRRERDGGVRLATGSDDGDEDLEEEILPPRYQRYN